ncbi:MAG: 3-oxoacyl-ACP reductase [Rhizobiales bacterium 65-9]|nr:SDR family oxidoreductase [Hyphomicrobiales bacterium]OJY35498.1 MAG: 3-oxoacyl-ACP reductase [Rhizobiales bacterium 65-9]
MGAIYPDLEGRAVLITGGGSGIGAALVEAFARQKSRVAFIDVNGEAASATAARIARDVGVEPAFRIVDLRDIGAAQAVAAELAKETGAFRALINNAGDDSRHEWRSVTPQLWDERFATNVRHQFFMAQAVAPAMAEAGGGAIINLGSISWMFGAAGLIAYTTGKSAIAGLTKSLARELGPLTIRVNAIAPGMIWTEKQIARAKADDPAKFERYLDRQCIKEHLDAEDVARLALWLASDESRRCAGQTYIVDGGVV